MLFSKTKISDVRIWVEEVYKYNGAVDLLKEFQEWNPPKFPVTGHALVERKVPGDQKKIALIFFLFLIIFGHSVE